MCCIFSKGTQQFDFIKCNIIRKLASKVKLMEVSLILLRNKFFKISWLDYEQSETIQSLTDLIELLL